MAPGTPALLAVARQVTGAAHGDLDPPALLGPVARGVALLGAVFVSSGISRAGVAVARGGGDRARRGVPAAVGDQGRPASEPWVR